MITPNVSALDPGQVDLSEVETASFPKGGRILAIASGMRFSAQRFYQAGLQVMTTDFDLECRVGKPCEGSTKAKPLPDQSSLASGICRPARDRVSKQGAPVRSIYQQPDLCDINQNRVAFR